MMYNNILFILAYIFGIYKYIQLSKSMNVKNFNTIAIYNTISILFVTVSISNIANISTIIGNITGYCFNFIINN